MECVLQETILDLKGRCDAEALKVPNGSLVTLNLVGNWIGPEGTAALAEALRVPNWSLVTFDFTYNYIGPEEAAALAEALKVPNGSLGILSLANDMICGVDGERRGWGIRRIWYPSFGRGTKRCPTGR